MKKPSRPKTSSALAVAVVVVAVGCNVAPPKQAGCPEGTVERGGECFPPESSGSGSADKSSAPSDGNGSGSGSSAAPSGDGAATGGSSGSSASVPYDKQMVDQRLARAAAQVKKNCGGATEDDGKNAGPWGKTKVTVTIDNNGHSRDTTIPAPFDGTAVGHCATNAFNGFQYPPFGGPDVKVDVDVELVKPDKK